jgi:hypothetical protein
MTLTPFTTKLKTLGPTRNIISITPPSFMKFCPVVPEICRGQVHGPRKERKKENNNNKKQSKHNKSPNVVGETKQEMIVIGCRYEVSQAKPLLIYNPGDSLRKSAKLTFRGQLSL